MLQKSGRYNKKQELFLLFVFVSVGGIGHRTSRHKLLDKVPRPLFDPTRKQSSLLAPNSHNIKNREREALYF